MKMPKILCVIAEHMTFTRIYNFSFFLFPLNFENIIYVCKFLCIWIIQFV